MVSSALSPYRRLVAALDLQLGKSLAEIFTFRRGEGKDISGVVQHGIGTGTGILSTYVVLYFSLLNSSGSFCNQNEFNVSNIRQHSLV